MNKKDQTNTQEEVVETPSQEIPVQTKTETLTFKDVMCFLKRELKRNKALIAALLVLILVAALYNFRSSIIVATVGGKPIYRWEIIKSLEDQMGQQALDNMISLKLIDNAATERGIVVSENEINLKSKTIEDSVTQSGMTMEQFLEQSGLTMEDYRDRIKQMIVVEKLLADKISVSEEEIDQYIEQNKEAFPDIEEDPQGRSLVKESLVQNKMSLEYDNMLQELMETGGVNILFEY